MDDLAKISREVASRINPLISTVFTAETLRNVAAVIDEIGYMVAETELAKDNSFRIFEVAAAALWWEANNVTPNCPKSIDQ